MLRTRRWAAAIVAAALTAPGFWAASAQAETVPATNFESFATGTVNGQGGWSSTGAAGGGCAVYDHAVVANNTIPGAPASFGTKSLRISDAVTSGCFGDQTFAPSVVNEAGEPTADAGTLGSGTRQGFFSSQFTFASVTPNAEQPGLHLSVSPDRGDGTRMSYVRIEDSPAGWNLFFDDYVDAVPLGSAGTPTNGYGAEDGFRETQIANGVSRTPHTLRFDISFAAGSANDVVKVFLDGTQIHLGTTWEDYYRWTQGTGGPEQTCACFASRTTRTLLFRSSGSAVPADAGNGLLIDNVTNSSGLADLKTTLSVPGAVKRNKLLTYTVTVTNSGPATAYNVTAVLAPPASGWTKTATTGGPVLINGGWWRSYASLGAGQSATFTATGKVGKLPFGTVLQAYAVASAANPPDPNLFTNLKVVATRVARRA